MEELKAMVTAIMDRLIEMTTRAVKAEVLAETYRVNMEKQREDKEFWRRAYDRVKADLDALKEKQDDTEGS